MVVSLTQTCLTLATLLIMFIVQLHVNTIIEI